MYHHINADKLSNKSELFEKHLQYMQNNYNIVVPGDKLTSNDICLTFDDAFYDIYYYAFPLLKKYNIKAVMGVPSSFILDDTNISSQDRLNVLHDEADPKKGCYCTFKELQEMVDSGLVIMASHSKSHVNLNETQNLHEEVYESKVKLEKELNIKVDSFIFPYGKYNDEVVSECKKHYKYLFRIGNGVNKDFSGIKDVIYRIDADELQNEKEIFMFNKMVKYRLKSLVKTFLG